MINRGRHKVQTIKQSDMGPGDSSALPRPLGLPVSTIVTITVEKTSTSTSLRHQGFRFRQITERKRETKPKAQPEHVKRRSE